MFSIEKVAQTALRATKRAAIVSQKLRDKVEVSFKAPKGKSLYTRIASGVVTNVDLKVQEVILKTFLSAGFNSCEVVAEEDTPSIERFARASSSRLFIDPIDGTLAYIWGNASAREVVAREFGEEGVRIVDAHSDPNNYGIVIGFEENNKCVFGVCALPARGIVYHAAKNSGLFRNGQPFSPQLRSDRRIISRSAFPPEVFEAYSSAGYSHRFTNCAPSNLFLLFEGDHRAFVTTKIDYPWQIQAFIAREAGINVTDVFGNEFLTDNMKEDKPSLILSKDRAATVELGGIIQRMVLKT